MQSPDDGIAEAYVPMRYGSTTLAPGIGATPAPTPRTPGRLWPLVVSVAGVFKLRIGLLIGVTALAGAFITPRNHLSPARLLALALGVVLAAAGAGALNQYAERDLDRLMVRTHTRAFASGRLAPHPAWLLLGPLVSTAGVVLVDWAANAQAAAFTLLGALVYGVVYTLWLKRRTPWNIVVGGLAGSFAVLAGAAAVSDPLREPLPLALALVLFLWTPPHFWSLAIACNDDYVEAGIPMLPAVVGLPRAARAVRDGAVLVVLASLVPAALGPGLPYLLAALAGGALLVLSSERLARDPTPSRAWRAFRASLVQLSLLLVAILANAVVPPA